MKLLISNKLFESIPSFSVSAYTFDLLERNDEDNLSSLITKAFNSLSKEYQKKYQLEDVVNIKKIKDTRDGYKRLKKDPSHTRPACEALLRRILKYSSIYRLGNVIDVGNLLSLVLLKSVCMVDSDKLIGDVTIRIGSINDEYYGINRGKINVSNLPLYCDEVSPFGNPTSDTLRTAVTINTKKIFIMLIHFSKDEIKEDELLTEEILNKYLKIKNLTKIDYEETN